MNILSIQADTMPSSKSLYLLAFIRLVGTMYFKKHLSVFSFNTPRALFMSLDENSMSAIDYHKRFIEVIRDLVWSLKMNSLLRGTEASLA